MDSMERTEDEMISRTFHRQNKSPAYVDGEENCRDTRSHADRNRPSQESELTRALAARSEEVERSLCHHRPPKAAAHLCLSSSFNGSSGYLCTCGQDH